MLCFNGVNTDVSSQNFTKPMCIYYKESKEVPSRPNMMTNLSNLSFERLIHSHEDQTHHQTSSTTLVKQEHVSRPSLMHSVNWFIKVPGGKYYSTMGLE